MASVPKRSFTTRRLDLTLAIELVASITIVAYFNYTRTGNIYYFTRERFKKYFCCLRKNVKYDSSFSLKEFRRVINRLDVRLSILIGFKSG